MRRWPLENCTTECNVDLSLPSIYSFVYPQSTAGRFAIINVIGIQHRSMFGHSNDSGWTEYDESRTGP